MGLISHCVAISPVVAAEQLAYVGPGAGLGLIGALLAVLAFIGLALLGPILQPIRWVRRWYRSRHGADASTHAAKATGSEDSAP